MHSSVCIQCCVEMKPKRKKRGSTKLEFAGWMVFPLGLPYTLWRMFAKYPVCRYCGSGALLLADTPAAQRLLNLAAPKEEVAEKEDIPLIPAKAVRLEKNISLDQW